MARLSLTLLGHFQLRSATAVTLTTKKAQALLSYLALPAGQPHPREKLAGLLWGDTGEEQARGSLRQTLSALRRALPAGKIASLHVEGQTVALNPTTLDVDVAAFERHVAEGTPEALEQAVALYRGDLLEWFGLREAPFEEWLGVERERLRLLAREALARLLALETKAGTAERAIQIAGRLLALDPLDEAVHRTLMRLYGRQGRWAPALRQYQLCVAVLQREFGVEPEPETKQIYQELLQRRSPRPAPIHAPSAPRARRPRRAGRPLQPATAALEPTLIGRERELSRLRRAMSEARRGQGQVVVVLGEAGIGKSRLIQELAAEALEGGGGVLAGRSYEGEHILPFGPWAEALRKGGVLGADVLEGLGGAWQAELTRLFPELGEPDPPLPPAPENYLRLFEAVAQLLAHLASKEPRVLVLEDLHWADEMSLRLLGFLGRRIRTWPLLLVGTAREEELTAVPALRHLLQELDRETPLVRLLLSPLSRAETATLMRALAAPGTADAAEAGLAEHVWTLSEGNPFVVVETMRALHEERAGAEGGRLPDRVREVIAGRLERLSERGQQMAAVAAVIGREFDFALLQRASGLTELEAAEGVEELVRRRVLQGTGERFDFVHDRIREVAYGQLFPPRRRVLHARVATALEALAADDLAGHAAALGVHYREGEIWDKALTYLRLAGAGAVARFAHREAVTCFEQALAALGHLPESRETLAQGVDLRLDLRSSLYPLGEHARILECLEEARALAEGLGERPRQGRVLSYLTHYFSTVGDPERAIDAGRRALALAATVDDPGLQITTRFYLAQVHAGQGDYRSALRFNRENLAVLEGSPGPEGAAQPALLVLTRLWLLWCLAELGEFAEGLARGDDALHAAERADQPFDRILAYLGVGLLHLRQGELDRAVVRLEQALPLCDIGDLGVWFPGVASPLGYAYVHSGRLDRGLPLLEQAVERTTSRMGFGHALRLVHQGEAYLLAGRPADARALARRALDLARERRDEAHHAYTLRLLAEIAAREDPPDAAEAEDHYRGALELAAGLGLRPLAAHCHWGLGRLYRRSGSRAEAEASLSRADALFREMGMRACLARGDAD